MSPTLDQAAADLQALREELPPAPGRVRLLRAERCCELILDAPAQRNALSLQMMVDLCAAAQWLQGWSGAALILRAEGSAFCAGGHLGQVRGGLIDAERGARMCAAMTSVLDAISRLPAICLVAVEGPAVGGGAELVTVADRCLIGPRASIHYAQGALGVAAGWGGAWRLVRRLGEVAALELLLSGERLVASEVLEQGLADELHAAPVEAARHRVERWLERSSVAAIRAFKEQVLAARPPRPNGREARAFASVWGGPVHRARMGGP